MGSCHVILGTSRYFAGKFAGVLVEVRIRPRDIHATDRQHPQMAGRTGSIVSPKRRPVAVVERPTPGRRQCPHGRRGLSASFSALRTGDLPVLPGSFHHLIQVWLHSVSQR